MGIHPRARPCRSNPWSREAGPTEVRNDWREHPYREAGVGARETATREEARWPWENGQIGSKIDRWLPRKSSGPCPEKRRRLCPGKKTLSKLEKPCNWYRQSRRR